jgi:predicted DCC family thiol-disulfide oxidoreductase YuxK
MQTANTSRRQPLLIYDGDCGFCIYWARYWQKLTGHRVTYAPYQEVATEYPEIPLAAFQRAVQYVAPDGKIASGAEACFLTLNHASGKSFWLTLYRHLPGFAAIAERTYAFIASHRATFHRPSVWLWGRDYEPPRFGLVSWLFLRAIGLIYLAAFVSFGVQALGLIGSHGILPLSEFIGAVRSQLGVECYWAFPMVFWLDQSDFAIQATCWAGTGLSLLLIFNVMPRLSLFFLYALYLSLFYAGQIFMGFQWDVLLLETGVLALFLSMMTKPGIWLLRWLLFRFMFLSGAQSVLIASTAATFVIELGLPFLIFCPRRLRFVAAFGILLLQALIILTGNYTFFNFLAMALCLVLFDDAALRKVLPQHLTRLVQRGARDIKPGKAASLAAGAFALLIVFASVAQIHAVFRGRISAPAMWLIDEIAPLYIVNTYGLFAVMTTARPEIIVEGSDDGVHWREYTFKYKPGDVRRPPRWNIPHQPRLDWQMWFAALGTPSQNPWFSRFLQRLLENSPEVTALLGSNPFAFPHQPPLYVRALLYDYRYSSREEKEKTGAWWVRQPEGIYYPATALQ